jgi:hypothetical protein
MRRTGRQEGKWVWGESGRLSLLGVAMHGKEAGVMMH